jgi:hypothetical protein
MGVVLAATVHSALRAEDAVDQALRLYAVHVVRVPKENWTGYGVYLGNGLVLTAGHVAGEFWRTVQVEIAGQMLPTEVLKRGQFSGVDLALLSIDDVKLPVSLRLRRMTVCATPPWPGEEVVVATPEGLARSYVVSPALLPKDLAPKFRTAIRDVATTGNSGSGVFDAWRECLIGIISAKIQQTRTRKINGQLVQSKDDVAKYFVPGPEITEFLPPDVAADHSAGMTASPSLSHLLAPARRQ